MFEMMEQVGQLPLWLQWWLRWMQFTLILLPFFFIKTKEAQIILIAQLFNFIVGGIVFTLEGNQITKLFGLGHIFWGVAFVMILMRWRKGLIAYEGRPLYTTWLFAAMVTLSISLPLDVYDTALYISGVRIPVAEYYQLQ